MKKQAYLVFCCVFLAQLVYSQLAGLGTYPLSVSINAGGNALLLPLSAPVNVTKAVASAGPGFKGSLLVNPVTGELSISNAHPAGTYFISVKAIEGTVVTAMTGFTLVVNNNACSQGLYTAMPGQPTGNLPYYSTVGDLNHDGKLDVVTVNYASNNISVMWGNGQGGFSGTLLVPVGTRPQGITLGDFNADGNQDIAVANFLSSNVSVLLSNGAGGFVAAPNVTAGAYPYSLATGDFNGDGLPDLAIANYGSNTVSVRLGNGGGGFTGNTNVPVGAGPRFVITADVNNDGNTDLATANYDNNTASVRLGNGAGGFNGTTELTVGTNPYSIAAGDLDGDGKTDLATANRSSNDITIRYGDGAGNFPGNSTIATGTNPRMVIIADLDGNGKSDLATGNIADHTVSVILQNSSGSYYPAMMTPVGINPYSIAAGDLNQDGIMDLVTTDAGSNTVTVLLGKLNEISLSGNGIVIADGDQTPSPGDHTDFGIVASNLVRTYTIENTGAVNLLVKNIQISGQDSSLFTPGGINLPQVLPPGSTATFTISFTPSTPGLKSALVKLINDDCDEAVYDFSIQGTGMVVMPPVLGTYPATTVIMGANANISASAAPENTAALSASAAPGFKGVLLADPLTGDVRIINANPPGTYTVTVTGYGVLSSATSFQLTVLNPNCSQGQFRGPVNLPAGNSPYALAVADVNNDGRQDFITAAKNSNTVLIHTADGNGGFLPPTGIPVGTAPVAVACGDLNGDGYTDIVSANSGSNSVSVLMGGNTGGFTYWGNLTTGMDPRAVLINDLNSDGKPDLITANYGNNNLQIRYGDGFGSFNTSLVLPVGSNPVSMAISDLNADGIKDIVCVNAGNNTVSVRLGHAAGGYTNMADIPVGMSPAFVTVADLNADGMADLLVANSGSNTVSVRMGNGAGDFTATAELPVGLNPVCVISGDFNGDGIPDIAASNANGNSLSTRLGNGSGGYLMRPDDAVGANPRAVVAGDFNQDGIQDLATVNAGSGNISILTGGQNDIGILGNNILIPGGSMAADLANHTDFGDVTTNLIRSFTIKNYGATGLKVNTVSIAGPDSAYFSIGAISLPAIIKPDSTVTFTVSFTPVSIGAKTATVKVLSDDCDEMLYDFVVAGNGISIYTPTLGAYPATVIENAGGNATVVPSAAPTNSPAITATASPSFKGLLSVDPASGMVRITNAQPAGSYLITVKVSGISTATSSFLLTVGNPGCSKGAFISSPDVASGNLPFAIAVGDFNGDGNQDLVMANYGNHTATVRLGDGNGGFYQNTVVPAGTNPYAVVTGDYNGDGKLDFAVANNGSSNVSVRLGDGNGGFFSSAEIPVGLFPTCIINADFNADGKLDLGVLSTGNNAVAIRLGDGSGNFNGSVNVPVGSGAFSLATGDFNNDGKPDLASTNYNVDNVSINLGDGLGGFNFLTDVMVGVNPYSIAVADLNADGKPDLVTANYNANTLSVRLGEGTGYFSGSTEVPVGAGPGSVVIGDLNGDGKPDLLSSNNSGNSISIRFGNGQGNFSGNSNISLTGNPYASVIGDFNHDGRHDIAISKNNNMVSILLGTDNEINVKGNGMDIADGDQVPAISNNTDFGVTNTASRSFVIENKGTGNLLVTDISISGNNASLFSVGGISLPATIPAGNSVVFNISFSPVRAGVYMAVITIHNDDCDESIYDFTVQGTFLCPAVPVSISGLPASLCQNSPAVTITGNPSPGGVFSGTGITGNLGNTAVFDPAIAGVGGPYPVLYIYTDANNDCVYQATQPVIVYDLPLVDFPGLNPAYCVDVPAVTLNGIPSGGFFTGTGVNGNIFEPAAAGPGTHAITYTYTNINGCSNSMTRQVMVNPLPLVDFSGFAPNYCRDAAPVLFTGSPMGGVFSGPGMNGDLFDPAAAGPGVHQVVYTYIDPDGCSNFAVHAITVNELPVITISGLQPSFCSSDAAVLITGIPSGGVFSGAGVSGNLFDPAAAGIGGPYPVSYTYTDLNGCSSSSSEPVVVHPLPVVSFSGLAAAYCTTDAAVTLVSNFTGSSFTMNGPGLTDNGNGTATFDPSATVTGNYVVTCTYTNGNGCTGTYTQPVSVSVCPLYSTLNLTLFLEGFYRGGGVMVSNLYDLGMHADPTAADEISIGLWSPADLSNAQPNYSVTALLHTDGTASMQFPPSIIGNSYYIVVRHRNSLETWSSIPVTFFPVTNYNFSDALQKAYDDGLNPSMADLGNGVFGIYSGDVNRDGTVDGTDASVIEITGNIFGFGYDVTDVNGDGATDGQDASVVEVNANKFIFYARPY